MRDMLIELASSWESYRSRGTTDKNHRVHNLVLRDIPQVLETWSTGNTNYLVRGSDGQGNILRTPWVATFNPTITTSATTGFYPVYLFKDNMKEMVLELGFGATQFKEKYGTGQKVFDEIELAVKGMQDSSKHLLSVLDPEVRARISKLSTSLNSEKDFNLRAYEKCSIYSLTYKLENLPTEDSLRFDYQELLKLYQAMAGSVLLPSEEEYVIENTVTPNVPASVHVNTFVPGVRKIRKSSASEQSGHQKRYSRSSDKVGRIGEEYVFNVERELLIRGGREDLAERVIWHRNHAENRTPGWDITSYNLDESIKYIEVKSSVGKSITNVTLTANEWEKASEFKGTNKYHLYLVTKILKDPEIHDMLDPASWVHSRGLELMVDTYLLYLGQRADEDEPKVE
jgi:hypothetical protein